MIEISLTALVAGTKYRGEFEERMEAVVREASAEPKPILFIDEIHLLLGAGSASGSMDAANILKPALARGAIRVIGATTTREYPQTIEKDGALERRFQLLRVEEPTAEESVGIITALRERLEAHHGVKLQDDALRAAVEWSVRYLPDFRLSDKALDLVDQACAALRFRTLTLQPLIEEKNPGGTPGSRPAARRSSYAGRSSYLRVGREEIAAVVAARCGIPVGMLTADEGERLNLIEKAHPRVLDLFLQIFDEGTLTDSQGRKCSFRESVIILTSNLGSGVVANRRMGFGMEDEERGQDAHAPCEEAIRKNLRPELVNRLARIVHFNTLGMDAAREVVGKLLSQLNERISDRGVTVELDESAVELILREGFSTE